VGGCNCRREKEHPDCESLRTSHSGEHQFSLRRREAPDKEWSRVYGICGLGARLHLDKSVDCAADGTIEGIDYLVHLLDVFHDYDRASDYTA